MHTMHRSMHSKLFRHNVLPATLRSAFISRFQTSKAVETTVNSDVSSRRIALSSDSRAEYETFMKSMEPHSHPMPEYQHFKPSHTYKTAGSMKLFNHEISVLEARKAMRLGLTRTGLFIGNEHWYHDLTTLRNGLRFGSLLIALAFVFPRGSTSAPIDPEDDKCEHLTKKQAQKKINKVIWRAIHKEQ